MSTDDRFIPQGKQILPKICQVRPMPRKRLLRRLDLTGKSGLFVGDNSCGHTTDFYPGKSDLPRANSSKICRGKFISGSVFCEKFWEGHTTDISSQGFHASWIFWSVNLRRQDAQGSS